MLASRKLRAFSLSDKVFDLTKAPDYKGCGQGALRNVKVLYVVWLHIMSTISRIGVQNERLIFFSDFRW